MDSINYTTIAIIVLGALCGALVVGIIAYGTAKETHSEYCECSECKKMRGGLQ
jgi:hypothetical protein